MKNYLILICVFFFSTLAVAQDTEWELYATVDGVEIYTRSVDCYAKNIPDQKAVIIKVVNTTGEQLNIEWDEAIWYNGEPVKENATDDENHYTISLPPNKSVEGECETPRGALYIYKDFITYETDVKLTKFELQNIKVSRL
ncbi:MAG: hypothetical protein WDZ35_07810 [Crocinitomicaceae bacterium]